MEFVRQKVREHGLPMRLLEAEYPLDENQLVVYFAAEGRVDFRALVADLKRCFPKRVMLFQIGARDAIRTIGAIGPCGRPSCCSLFLRRFESVTMKMAKEQLLDLNPSRLLGACGKLKCCLRYEHELYCEALCCMPKIGQWVQTPKGRGQVTDLNVLLMKVTVALEDGGYSVWHVSEISPLDSGLSTSYLGSSESHNGDEELTD
jgi:cell fate regulator YaaT (PSP1 superfamily)